MERVNAFILACLIVVSIALITVLLQPPPQAPQVSPQQQSEDRVTSGNDGKASAPSLVEPRGKPQDSKGKNEAHEVTVFGLRVGEIVLAFATFMLWWVTNSLVRETKETTKAQQRDTRILQRAYISVEPLGIDPFISDEPRVVCLVGFHNTGNLPARGVSWSIRRAFSQKSRRRNFPIGDQFFGNILIPKDVTAPKGSTSVSLKRLDRYRGGPDDGSRYRREWGADSRYLYVWGRVRYQDGFGNPRYTDFCHRYNLGSAGPNGVITFDKARYHEHGNRTGEDAG